MKKIIDAKWYEYLLSLVSLAVLVTLGIIFHSSPLIICLNITCILMMFFITKGSFVGTILQIINARESGEKGTLSHYQWE